MPPLYSRRKSSSTYLRVSAAPPQMTGNSSFWCCRSCTTYFISSVDFALYRGQHDGSLLAALFLLHLGLEVGHRGLHHTGRVEYRGQLHLARAKQLAHGLHAVEQDVVNDVERRVIDQRLV